MPHRAVAVIDSRRDGHGAEVARGERFRFGENWLRFLEQLDEPRIQRAERSLTDMLGVRRFDGLAFIDVGSGSGLFSLAARRLGARVVSLDYDPESVACTREMKRRYRPNDDDWSVHTGSVLDPEFLGTLGRFDLVFSWGVLHHTGRMWDALNNVVELVDDGGSLLVALYNDQGAASRRWLRVKQAYNRLPSPLRGLVLWPTFARLWGPTAVRDLVRGRPNRSWREYAQTSRGMSPWRDVVDWVGGLPFEVATPEAVIAFYEGRGFELRRLERTDGHGCNEFVFRRSV